MKNIDDDRFVTISVLIVAMALIVATVLINCHCS